MATLNCHTFCRFAAAAGLLGYGVNIALPAVGAIAASMNDPGSDTPVTGWTAVAWARGRSACCSTLPTETITMRVAGC